MTDMSSIPRHPASPPTTAAEWMARLNAHDCTEEDRGEFAHWLDRSPQNRAAYARCEKLWAMPGQLASHSDMFAQLVAKAEAIASIPTTSSLPRRPVSRPWMALAAGLATIAILGGALFFHGTLSSNRIATAAGEQRTVTLPDGSVVTLNGRTTLSSAFTESERRVEMQGGEAFFDVAKNPARPFIVRAGNSEVRVVGTQFNVRQVHGELEVVVREGKVNVIPDSTVAPTASVPRVELRPGNRLVMNTHDNQVSVAEVNPERLTAWRTGMIKFDAVALEDVIEDVNRYTDKPLVIKSESLRSLPISGRFRVGDTDSVRFLLRERFDVESTVEADRIVLR